MDALNEDLDVSEVGNTLIAVEGAEGGGMAAWLDLPGGKAEGHRLEVVYLPGDSPELTVRSVSITDRELAEYIEERFGGWKVRRLNLEEPLKVDETGRVIGSEEDDYE